MHSNETLADALATRELETIRERFAQGAAEHGGEDMAATYLTSTPP